MTCGIYLLEFNGTDKVYVGLSKYIERRYKEHLVAFNSGKHTLKLMEAYSQYGLPTLKIILECDKSELGKAEQEAIELFDSIKNGFNSTGAGSLGCSLIGDKNPASKYSNEQIEQVFTYILENVPFKEIAYKTGVSLGVISLVSCGTNHTWLRDKYPEQYKKLLKSKHLVRVGEAANGSKYTNEQIEQVFILLINSTNINIIEAETNVPKGTIYAIAQGKVHNWLKDKHPESYAILMGMKYRYKEGIIEEIFHLLLLGTMTLLEIAKVTGVSKSTVGMISSGKTHKWLSIKYPEKYTYLMSMKGNRHLKDSKKLTNGEITERIINIRTFSKKYNLNTSSVTKVLNGEQHSTKGWYLV